MTAAVDFKNVDIVFGADAAEALALLDKGATRAEILEKTGTVLGCAGASLDRQRGRDLRADGPVRLRQIDAAEGRQPAEHGRRAARCWSRTATTWSTSSPAMQPTLAAAAPAAASPWCSSSSALLPWRTVEENVGLGLELAGVPEAERKERVDQAAEARRPRPVGEEIRA